MKRESTNEDLINSIHASIRNQIYWNDGFEVDKILKQTRFKPKQEKGLRRYIHTLQSSYNTKVSFYTKPNKNTKTPLKIVSMCASGSIGGLVGTIVGAIFDHPNTGGVIGSCTGLVVEYIKEPITNLIFNHDKEAAQKHFINNYLTETDVGKNVLKSYSEI